MDMIKQMIMRKTLLLSLIFIVSTTCVYAWSISNTLNNWNPSAIQGSIMEVGPDYIIVLEKKIMVVDTTSWGKRVKTIISDGKGKDLDRRNLKKGVIVFVKGSLADDEQNGDVLAATEIYIVPHLLGPKDAKEYKGFMVPATPW